MNISTALIAARLVSAGTTLANAETILAEVVNLIQAAEAAYEGLAGNEKLQAVKAGIETLLTELGLQKDADALMKVIAPAISFIATILKLTGQLKPQVTQPSLFPTGAAPAAA